MQGLIILELQFLSKLIFETMNKKEESSPKPLTMEWYRGQSEKERKLFESVLLILIAVGFLLIYTLTKDLNESGYYKIHSALFYCNIIVFLIFIVRRNDIIEICKSTYKAIVDVKNSGLKEFTDSLFFALGVIFIVSVLFVIDTSFLSNYGIRIGAVAAFGLVMVLKSVVISFKN